MTLLPRTGRRVALVALVVLGALAAIVAAGEATGWPGLREPVARTLSNAFGVPVVLEGGFRVRFLLSPSVRAERVGIGAASRVPVPHLLQARELHARARWGELWRWRQGHAPLRLRVLEAQQIDVHLARLADGRASWQLGAAQRTAGAPPQGAGRAASAAASAPPARRDEPARDEADATGALPQIDLLAVREGLIRVLDEPQDTELRIDVAGLERAGGDGAYRATVRGRWRALPLDLDLRSGRLLPLLARDAGDEAMQPLAVRGRAGAAEVSFEGKAADLIGARRIDGRARIGGPSLAAVARPLGVTLPVTPPFDLDTRLRHADGRWQVNIGEARIGKSQLAGELLYDGTKRPPLLAGRLAGPRLALADLGPAIGTNARRDPDKVLPQRRFDLAALRRMDADVEMHFDRLVLGTPRLEALGDVRTRVRLDNGVLALVPFEAAMGGGRMTLSTRLDGREKTARWTAEIALRNVDIAEWAPAAEEQARLTGRLEADLSLTAAGLSSAELLATTDGRVRARLREGTLSHLVTEGAGLDLAEALGLVIRGDKTLPLRCAALDARLEDGVMHIERGLVDNRDSTLMLGGRVHLRGERLELVVRSKPKDFSPLAVRSPITLTGTFAAPQLGIDKKHAAKRVLGALVLGAVVGPVAALLPLADKGDPPEEDPCAAARAPAAQAAAGGGPPKR